MTKLGWIVVVIVAGLAGCGDSTGPISPGDAEDGCRATCEREATCGQTTETVAQCTADCVADVAGGGIREDAFNDIADCIVDLVCTASEETCIMQCRPTSAHESYEDRCRVKMADCGATGTQLDQICETSPTVGEVGFVCLFTPEVMDEMRGCLDLACTEISACFDTVLARYGFNG
jgi:hypothetical protein